MRTYGAKIVFFTTVIFPGGQEPALENQSNKKRHKKRPSFEHDGPSIFVDTVTPVALTVPIVAVTARPVQFLDGLKALALALRTSGMGHQAGCLPE